ncbi:zinc-ribbon domain containing protein|uniref:CxxC-x17-CxxC domain-containing protein n=1 Tax=Dendrosporobacter quercicolus TaxID=146817 RepID=A0A1G9QV74_9FIRM|nr:zinc-ribbon domain containing protein [Dendrosporobacter quercicolus]NSL48364.1 zinc-ribbon domain containing protein [Dendrosporobacter quercicolus DSM 1736]SDM14517.1 CxxC-x17-CxxC domain-containing protein [Dendrosporobacter quercicolus]
MFQDKTLTCRECGIDFLFTASEQEFFAGKGFMNDPGRCPACRAARKQRQDTGRSGSLGAVQREMFDAVCADCGIDTQVPFRPSGDRPVYCRQCFSRHHNR